LSATLQAMSREPTMVEWVTELADLDICFGPVATLGEMMRDPQVRHRGMVLETPSGPTLGNPIKLSETPPVVHGGPPELGRDTDAVLRGLGYSPGDVAALREAGVV
jgi:formyl-CoA transferase